MKQGYNGLMSTFASFETSEIKKKNDLYSSDKKIKASVTTQSSTLCFCALPK